MDGDVIGMRRGGGGVEEELCRKKYIDLWLAGCYSNKINWGRKG